MKAQFENKPLNKRKKRSYIPSDVSKFTMSYLDVNRLRKEVQTSRDKISDRKYGNFSEFWEVIVAYLHSTRSSNSNQGSYRFNYSSNASR